MFLFWFAEDSVSTLKRIKHEGTDSSCRCMERFREISSLHKPIVLNLGSFDIDAIRNKINEFYI